jgi:RNA polymerase sigma-70 factor (ECF subfamily)
VSRSSRRGLQSDGAPSLLPQDPITEPLPVIEATGNGRRRPGEGLPAGTADRAVTGTADRAVTPPGVLRLSSSPSRQESQPNRQERQTTSQASAAAPLDDARVDAAKRGDQSAWESAYLVYGRALMGYLMMRLENRDDAAEALSETFVRAIDKASSFRGDAYAFRAWLFSIARNVSTDQHRFRARLVVIPEIPETDDRPQPSGDDLAILADEVGEIRRGFARLPQADQEVLWLRVCSGLSAADVGKVLGKRAGAVRMQQLRALDSLRGQMTL